MSHTDDVINQGYKEAYQIHKKSWIFKTDEDFLFWTLNYLIWDEYPCPYFLHFSKTL